MSLATRCPACGTVFRVVQDQLRVSQGWVRCGRCSEAFNALESMIDLTAPRTAPEPAAGLVSPAPAAAEPEVPPAPSAAAAPPAAATEPPPEEPVPQPEPAPRPEAEAEPEPPSEPGPEPTAAPADAAIEVPPGMAVIASDGAIDHHALLPPPVDEAATRAEPSFGFEPPAPAPNDSRQPSAAADEPDLAPLSEFPPDLATAAAMAAAQAAAHPLPPRPMPEAPSFVVKADRAARWRQPRVRAALALLAVLGVVTLGAQVLHTFRDRIAASSPSLRPALQQACAALGCRVGDYRQIDALSVESSGLTRVEGSSVYRLSVTLRNRAPLDVAAPALDLALTDASGKPIARRVLQMSDLNLPLRNLKPGSELPIQVPLGIGDRQAVAGYTVEIFYP